MPRDVVVFLLIVLLGTLIVFTVQHNEHSPLSFIALLFGVIVLKDSPYSITERGVPELIPFFAVSLQFM